MSSRLQMAEKIEKLLQQYRRYFGYVGLSARKEPGKALSAEELNIYVESRGLLSQKDLWIELSKTSAFEQLHTLIDHISEDYEVRDGEVGSPTHITNLFMKTFSSSARFFTNGIYFHLSEYSVIEGTNTIMNVSHPFRSEASGRGLLNAWNPFKGDLDYDAIGVLAILVPPTSYCASSFGARDLSASPIFDRVDFIDFGGWHHLVELN